MLDTVGTNAADHRAYFYFDDPLNAHRPIACMYCFCMHSQSCVCFSALELGDLFPDRSVQLLIDIQQHCSVPEAVTRNDVTGFSNILLCFQGLLVERGELQLNVRVRRAPRG